ncbi:MAG: N-6 DNA methylase, partial [Burkholderiales bacterium]|nr:N-6 DNA methylase [Burkholderiales bacterium]
LALPALGSFLFSAAATGGLDACELENSDMLDAVRALAFTEENRVRRAVDYRNLQSEELGSVYESLLELHPELNVGERTFALDVAAGNERKTTGSYYTPDSLVQCLLDSALEPVLDRAATAKDPEAAILALKVCDPAVGSGHFLVAAAHRMAKRLAAVRTGDAEPAPDAVRAALRDVISRCMFGVDMNPMAVELCKVNLWLEALDPGRPLGFLDHHIQCGNALLGTTPELIADGIPDTAYKPIEGDDPEVAKAWKARNKTERQAAANDAGRGLLALMEGPALGDAVRGLEAEDDAEIGGVHRKEQRWQEIGGSESLRREQLLADAWCVAFVARKVEGEPPVTERLLERIRQGEELPKKLRASIEGNAAHYGLFHWHLAFPQVFGPDGGGFDVVLGNPPWERTSFEELQFFQNRNSHLYSALTTAERRRLIAELEESHDPLYDEYVAARRITDSTQHLATKSGLFRLTSVGRTDTYALFTELATLLISDLGLAGLVLPTGIATAIPLQSFWRAVFLAKRVKSLSDFENRAKYFPGVHNAKKFCLFTVGGSRLSFATTLFGFFLPQATASSIQDNSFPISAEEIERVNPDTGQPPIVPSRRDLELLIRVHRNAHCNGDQTPGWVGYTSAGTGDSWIPFNHVGEPSDSTATMMPLIEGKMVHQFDHRFATYELCSQADITRGEPAASDARRESPEFSVMPRFRVPRIAAGEFLDRKSGCRCVVPVYRDYTSATNERTLIATLLADGVPMQPLNGFSVNSAGEAATAVARLNSFAIDFVARLKTPDIHLNVTIFNQLPGSPLDYRRLEFAGLIGLDWITARVLELVYVSADMKPFARDLGYDGPPFVWDADRRFYIRAELDAAFFHLYGLSRDDVDYIMDTFPIVRRHDEAAHNEYR